MAEVPVNINGVIVDLYGRTIMGPVKIVGSMSRTDVGVGGGPIYPPGNGDKPPGEGPPGIWGPPGPWPTPPIYIPPQIPPGLQPPTPPEPGDPTTAVPGNWPVAPIVPPPYIVVQYPGVGPVVVAPPAPAESEPKPA